MSPDRPSPADPPASGITAPTSPPGPASSPQPVSSAAATPDQPVRAETAAVPVSGRIWLTGQHPSRTQRARRYTPESMAHPAKMMPTVAAHAIATFTRPGEWVCDPMCGIGTTLVEALHRGPSGPRGRVRDHAGPSSPAPTSRWPPPTARPA